MVATARPALSGGRAVQFCCQRLLAMEPEFARVFHRELSALTPSMLLAPVCSPALSADVAHCLLWAALTQDPADVVETAVREFAAGHRGRGFPDDAYPNIGHALLRSVRVTLPVGWSSALSSGLVSYALWLQPQLQAGARSAAANSGSAGSGSAGSGSARPRSAGPAGTEPPLSLELILSALQERYFKGQERSLRSISTRVMLRTGADLTNPRPEQRTDPVVIAEVLQCLLLMGYEPVPGRLGVGRGQPASAAPVGPVGGGSPFEANSVGPVGGGSPFEATPVGRPRRAWWRLQRRGR
jgi:hypothetical protein